MNSLLKILAKSGLLKGDLDYHLALQWSMKNRSKFFTLKMIGTT